MNPMDALPPERLDAARAALARIFPGQGVTGVERLAGAGAIGVFRFTAGGQTYVLRADGPPDALRDPARQLACAQIASAGGIGPDIIDADRASRITITRFIPPVQTPWPGRLAETAAMVRRMHELPLFPAFIPYRDAMAGVIAGLTASGVLPPSVQAQLADLSAQVLAAYPWDGDLVSSHNDLNPSNIVFDGTRSWIVDWETAFAADRYVDVASLTNWLTSDTAGEQVVLEAYFGGTPTDYQRARLYLMRQINRLFYGGMLTMAATWIEPELKLTQEQWEAAPGLDILRPEMGTLAVHSGRIRFGCGFLKDGVAGLTGPGFAAAVAGIAV